MTMEIIVEQITPGLPNPMESEIRPRSARKRRARSTPAAGGSTSRSGLPPLSRPWLRRRPSTRPLREARPLQRRVQHSRSSLLLISLRAGEILEKKGASEIDFSHVGTIRTILDVKKVPSPFIAPSVVAVAAATPASVAAALQAFAASSAAAQQVTASSSAATDVEHDVVPVV